MPPTPLYAQYIMWGMLVIIIGLMIAIYFHFKDMPIRDLTEEEEDGPHCPHCGETLEDHADAIARRCKDDPTHTPYN